MPQGVAHLGLDPEPYAMAKSSLGLLRIFGFMSFWGLVSFWGCVGFGTQTLGFCEFLGLCGVWVLGFSGLWLE
jgi:hypothetical protein